MLHSGNSGKYQPFIESKLASKTASVSQLAALNDLFFPYGHLRHGQIKCTRLSVFDQKEGEKVEDEMTST